MMGGTGVTVRCTEDGVVVETDGLEPVTLRPGQSARVNVDADMETENHGDKMKVYAAADIDSIHTWTEEDDDP